MTAGTGCGNAVLLTPFILQKMTKEIGLTKLVPPAARRYAALSSGTRMWLNGGTSVRGSNRAVLFVLLGFWLKGGEGGDERVL